MSSFKSCKLFKFKYAILLLAFALFSISQNICRKYRSHYKFCSSSLIFFFGLCYETGGSAVGKSYLLNKYDNGNYYYFKASREGKKTFNNEHKSDQMIFFGKFSDLSLNSCLFVLLVCTHFKKVRLDPNITVTLKIQDTSGSKLFLPGETAIVVYDITQRRSFEEAKELVDEFTQQASPGAFVALVGNKADLESRREVSFKVSNVAMFI